MPGQVFVVMMPSLYELREQSSGFQSPGVVHLSAAARIRQRRSMDLTKEKGVKLDAAPWFQIPNKRFICIEHPGIIVNPERGIATIGGEKALTKLVETNGATDLELRLRPDDPFQLPIHSRTVQTNNLLLKISIPKRRRKKGSSTCYVDNNGQQQGTQGKLPDGMLLDKLKKANGNYKVEVMGTIETTVRFRDMADFQYSTANSPFIQKLKNTLYSGQYDKIKEFSLEVDHTPKHIDMLPPPIFSNTLIPHIYNYRQNPAIKKALIGGQATLMNLQAAPKTLTTMVHISTPEVPTGPPLGLPDPATLDETTLGCIEALREAFSKRPIWTRRALLNNIPHKFHPLVRFSVVHVAYMWRAGPWRDTCCRYGINPTLDPNFRKYQSLFFQIEVDKGKKQRSNCTSHIFDGKTLIRDGRCFQLCDITDPVLKSLIDRENLRKKCDHGDGWYRSGTMLKLKRIMRQRIRGIIEGRPLTEEEVTRILGIDSDEDEEGNQNPKPLFGGHRAGAAKGKTKASDVARGENSTVSHRNDEMDEEDDEEGDEDGEWEAEVGPEAAMLASEWVAEKVDKRVDQFMTEFMRHEREFGDDQEEQPVEDDFDVLGESSDEEQ